MLIKKSTFRLSRVTVAFIIFVFVMAIISLYVSIFDIRLNETFLLQSNSEIHQNNIGLSHYDASRSWDHNSMRTCEDSNGKTTVNGIMSVPVCSYEMNVCNCRRGHDETSSNNNIAIQLMRNQSIDTLQIKLDCNSMKDRKPILNFYSTAYNEPYESFLLLYAYRALKVHNDSFVEMVVSDIQQFIHMHQQALLFLLNQFGYDTVCIRKFHNTTLNRTRSANTWRYLEPPVIIKAKYTYIGDVDIMFTESVLDLQRFEQMRYFNLPYSNVIRPNSTRLTGLMLLKTDKFYTPVLLQEQSRIVQSIERGNDEAYLYNLVERSKLGLPKQANNSDILTVYRPLHGVHLSNSRGPGKRLCLTNFNVSASECTILNDSKLNDFLCQDDANGHKVLSKFFNALQEQELHRMEEIDGICQRTL